jgi:hypothetical protein
VGNVMWDVKSLRVQMVDCVDKCSSRKSLKFVQNSIISRETVSTALSHFLESTNPGGIRSSSDPIVEFVMS